MESPQELTAANGAGSTLESLAFFLGPAIGGLLLTVADVPIVFVLQAATFLWSAALVSAIRVPVRAAAVPASVGAAGSEGWDGEPDATQQAEGFWAESAAGLPYHLAPRGPAPRGRHLLRADRRRRCVDRVRCRDRIDITGFGPEGVGYLDSVLGVGALLGGLLAIGRASKFRLASDFGVGVLFWALPLLLVSVWPQAAPAFLAMFVIGAANPVVDVNASTILQRLSPDAVLGRRVRRPRDTG